MSRRRLKGAVAALLLAANTAQAAQTAMPTPRPPHLRPPDAASPEAGLWYQSDKAEVAAKSSGELDGDIELTAYVRRLECRVAAEYCDDMRVYVFDRPFFNAQAAPNGYVEVWTGALLRARDEAELAFILGHETTHFAMNHSVVAEAELKSRMSTAMILSLVLAAGAATATYSAGGTQAPNTGGLSNIFYLSAIAGYFSFNREQESEADRLGLKRAVAAGYDPGAGARLWTRIIGEQLHSDFERVRKRPATGSLFDNHPLDGERLDVLKRLAADSGQTGLSGAEALRAVIRPHLSALLRDDLRRRDYGQTLYIIEQKLADHLGDDGVLNYFRGECFRQRRGEGDAENALAAYISATAFPDAPAAAWREIGAYYERQHDASRAAAAYHAYIDHAPTAQDRWLVEASLKKLES